MLLPKEPKFFNETFPSMNNDNLKFTQLGYDKCAPSAIFSHFRDFYIIQFINKGCGYIKTDGDAIKLKTNDAFIVKPNELLTQIADEDDPWELLFFAFGGPMAEFLFKRTVFVNKPYVSFDDDKIGSAIGNSIYSIIEDNSKTMTNFEILFNLLSFFQTSNTPQETITELRKNTGEDIVDLVKNYIKSNYSRPIKISDIANQLNLNRSHLFRVFKKRTNMSIEDYLTMTRINQACHLLKTTNFTVNTISSLVGFSYYPNFFKHFKENVGTTPTKYRNG